MYNERMKNQAREVENLMPAIARRLFAIDPNHPANHLPAGQVRLCAVLQNGPRSMTLVGDELNISQSAVTQLVDRLEKSGMVERVAEPEDRRVRLVRLTVEGENVMRSRRDERLRRTERALAQLSEETRESVICALDALLDASISLSAQTAADD